MSSKLFTTVYISHMQLKEICDKHDRLVFLSYLIHIQWQLK